MQGPILIALILSRIDGTKKTHRLYLPMASDLPLSVIFERLSACSRDLYRLRKVNWLDI
jgi:hypothetical protein